MVNQLLINELKLLCKNLGLNFDGFAARAAKSPQHPDTMLEGMLELLKAGLTKDQIIGFNDMVITLAADRQWLPLLTEQYQPPLSAWKIAEVANKLARLAEEGSK